MSAVSNIDAAAFLISSLPLEHIIDSNYIYIAPGRTHKPVLIDATGPVRPPPSLNVLGEPASIHIKRLSGRRLIAVEWVTDPGLTPGGPAYLTGWREG